eukprot:scaffold158661_cov47-Cyclotella_meneghiniana.AAC.1
MNGVRQDWSICITRICQLATKAIGAPHDSSPGEQRAHRRLVPVHRNRKLQTTGAESSRPQGHSLQSTTDGHQWAARPVKLGKQEEFQSKISDIPL